MLNGESELVTGTSQARLPWWGWALVAAVGFLLFIGSSREDATTATTLPPPDTRVTSGQTLSATLIGGEPKTVYWNFLNQRRRVRATAECLAYERDSGLPVELTSVSGDKRIDNWNAIYTLTPARTGVIEITCVSQKASKAEFGVGEELPHPKLFNGVEDVGKSGITLVGMVFLLPFIIACVFVPVKPRTKPWLFGFWVPLLLAVVITFGTNSVGNGFAFWVVWFVARTGVAVFRS